MNTVDPPEPEPRPNFFEPPRPRDLSPRPWAEVFDRVVMWVVLSPVILMASGVAFVATCLPVGAILQVSTSRHGDPAGADWKIIVACLVGGVAALGAAYALIRAIRGAGDRKSP